MAEKIKLNLDILENAKICNEHCEHKHDDGTLEVLGKSSIIACVGCGRKCHMQCAKVPKNMIDSVNKVPRANRHFAYYGQMSYTRIVCDTCANLLNENVSKDSPPTFQALFERIATKVFDDKISAMLESMEKGDSNVGVTKAKRNSSKRSKPDHAGDDDMHEPMKSMLQLLINKVTELSCNVDRHNVVSNGQINDLKKSMENIDISLNTQLTSMETNLTEKIEDATDHVKACSLKLEKNGSCIESGMQMGFNNLMQNAQKWMTPVNSPARQNSQRISLRRGVLENNAFLNNNETPKAVRSAHRSVPQLPTDSGSNENNDIFGRIVNRRIDFNAVNRDGETDRKQGQSQFMHDTALYVRFVDPSVTTAKMMDIVKMNATLNDALINDPTAIEVTRLVKKNITEDQIAGFKYGISFRIGCVASLYETLQAKSNWATHWQIRPWDRDFKTTKTRDTEERDTECNDLNMEELEIIGRK